MFTSRRIKDAAIKTVRKSRPSAFVDYIRDLNARKPLQHSYPTDLLTKYNEELNKMPPYLYAGFDPTASSLHIGNLLILVNLFRSQQYGLRPIALVGEFTASIGDPSGKKTERALLDADSIIHNSKQVTIQIRKIFENTSKSHDELIIANNNDWLGQISLRNFMRECKVMQVGKMLRMKTIKNRLNEGMSYTEFSYQTMQAYDWYTLSKNFGCRFQLGGYDQLGHLDFGAHYLNKVLAQSGNDKINTFAAGVCFPILTDSSGNKLGKTEKGNTIWLDPLKTSPFHFYQFFRQLHDDKAEELLLLFSLRTIENVKEILKDHKNNLGKWIAQKELAAEITETVHGKEGLDLALRCSKAMFGGKQADLSGLTRGEILQLFQNTIDLEKNSISTVGQLADATRSGNCKGHILMQKGAFAVNEKKKRDPNESIKDSFLANATDLTLVCWGKRDYQLIRWI